MLLSLSLKLSRVTCRSLCKCWCETQGWAGQDQTWRFRKKLLFFLWEPDVDAEGGTEMSLLKAETKCRS